MKLNCEYYTDSKRENRILANFNKYTINRRNVPIVDCFVLLITKSH